MPDTDTAVDATTEDLEPDPVVERAARRVVELTAAILDLRRMSHALGEERTAAIRELRARGLTFQQIADLIDVSPQAVYKMLNTPGEDR